MFVAPFYLLQSDMQNLESQVKDLTRQLQISKEIIQRLEQENQQLKKESRLGMMKPATIGGATALMVCGSRLSRTHVLTGVPALLWAVCFQPSCVAHDAIAS